MALMGYLHVMLIFYSYKLNYHFIILICTLLLKSNVYENVQTWNLVGSYQPILHPRNEFKLMHINMR